MLASIGQEQEEGVLWKEVVVDSLILKISAFLEVIA